MGASRDEILPIFLKYNIEMNGSAEEKKKVIMIGLQLLIKLPIKITKLLN